VGSSTSTSRIVGSYDRFPATRVNLAISVAEPLVVKSSYVKIFFSPGCKRVLSNDRDFTIELSRVIRCAPISPVMSMLRLLLVSLTEKREKEEKHRMTGTGNNKVCRASANIMSRAVCPMSTNRRERQTNNRCALFFTWRIRFNSVFNRRKAAAFSALYLFDSAWLKIFYIPIFVIAKAINGKDSSLIKTLEDLSRCKNFHWIFDIFGKRIIKI